MSDVVSQLLKINLRVRSKENIRSLLCDVLGASMEDDRGTDTIGAFEASTFKLGGVLFDVVVPSDAEAPLAKVIDKFGEGVDSICFAVDSMDYTQERLKLRGIDFSRLTEFHSSKVAFVHPRDFNGVGLEFIEGPLVDSSLESR